MHKNKGYILWSKHIWIMKDFSHKCEIITFLPPPAHGTSWGGEHLPVSGSYTSPGSQVMLAIISPPAQ